MLAKRLPVPAYDHLLKLSHTFNLLDARGAVGVTGETPLHAWVAVGDWRWAWLVGGLLLGWNTGAVGVTGWMKRHGGVGWLVGRQGGSPDTGQRTGQGIVPAGPAGSASAVPRLPRCWPPHAPASGPLPAAPPRTRNLQSAPTALPPCGRWQGRSRGCGWRGARSRDTRWAWYRRRRSRLRRRRRLRSTSPVRACCRLLCCLLLLAAPPLVGGWRRAVECTLGCVLPAAHRPAAIQRPSRAACAATFVLEVGSEELPPDDVVSALQQLKDRVPALLDRLRLGHGGVTVEGTPRRLAVLVHELAARQSNNSERVRGPPAKVAYDAAGTPIPALLGFCKKNGVTGEQRARQGFGEVHPDLV